MDCNEDKLIWGAGTFGTGRLGPDKCEGFDGAEDLIPDEDAISRGPGSGV
jgi:hypothetical protein